MNGILSWHNKTSADLRKRARRRGTISEVHTRGTEITNRQETLPENSGYRQVSSITADGVTTITNVKTTSFTAAKVWLDDGTPATVNARPAVTITLLANNEPITPALTDMMPKGFTASQTLPTSGTLQVAWNDLPMYDANGSLITYTASEAFTDATYDQLTPKVVDGVYTFYNAKRVTSIAVTKVWNDDLNRDARAA